MKSFLKRERASRKYILERVHLLSGFENSLGQEIYGIFEVSICPELIREQMERAARNKSKQSSDGPVRVFYKPATKEQAELLIEQLQRAATPGPRKTQDLSEMNRTSTGTKSEDAGE